MTCGSFRPPEGTSIVILRRWGVTVFLLFFLIYALYSYSRYEPHSFTRADPAWMVHAVISLATDGDLDLRNQLGNNPERAADQTALGARGEWFPLHEPVQAVAALPFYLGGGVNGLLVFNILCSAALQTLVFVLCARMASPLLALAATILIGCGTLLLPYSYSFSQDLWGTVLVLSAFKALVDRRAGVAGALFGLAVLSRYVVICTAPGLLLLLWDARALRRFVLAGAPFAALLLFANWWQFGSPWQPSYHHWQRYDAGSLQLASQLQVTFVKPWGTGLKALLFDPESGFRGTIPMWPLAIFGLVVGIKQRPILAVAVIAIGHLLFFCRFEGYPGTPGNRYLMVCAALAAMPIAVLLEWIKMRLTPVLSRKNP